MFLFCHALIQVSVHSNNVFTFQPRIVLDLRCVQRACQVPKEPVSPTRLSPNVCPPWKARRQGPPSALPPSLPPPEGPPPSHLSFNIPPPKRVWQFPIAKDTLSLFHQTQIYFHRVYPIPPFFWQLLTITQQYKILCARMQFQSIFAQEYGCTSTSE